MDTNMEKRHFDIITGPNKDRLFDACRYYNEEASIPIHFSIAVGYDKPRYDPRCTYIEMYIKNVKIRGIENDSNSKEEFIIKGDCEADLNSFGDNPKYQPKTFSALYNAKSRKGFISFFNN